MDFIAIRAMDPQAAAAQQAAKVVYTQRLKYAFQLASIAMLYYDYSLTFSDELKYIWRRRWRLSSLFYVFCRYALVANLLYFISIIDGIPMDCDAGYITCSVLSIFGHIGIIAVWGLRTYAICDKNKIIAVLLGFPGIATIIMLIVRAPVTRCNGPVTFPGIRGGIAASMVVFDVLAFSFASLRAWRTIRADRKAGLSVKSSADYVIFSQGLNYMAPVFGLSVASISMNWTVVLTFSRFMNAFKLPLSGLITARFLLELRKWEEKGKGRKGDDCLSLPQWAYDPSSEQAATASIPRFSVRDSTGSIFTDLGGDIGPRRRESHDEDFEDSEQMTEYESEGITTRRSSIRKGKQREDSPDQGTSTSQVVSLSARRHTFAETPDITSPVQNAASSQCRERALTSPRLNRKGSD